MYVQTYFGKRSQKLRYFVDLIFCLRILDQRSNIVNKHKGFMFDTTSFITKPAFNKLPIPIGVMDATVRELNGSDKEIKNLISSANGKVILIDFWASWCAPCITEMPYLKKAGKKFKDKVTIFSISIDSDVSNWKKAVKKYNLFLNSFLIEDFENHQIVKYLQLNTIPRIILINSKGKLLESDFLKPSNKNFEIILEDIITQQQ